MSGYIRKFELTCRHSARSLFGYQIVCWLRKKCDRKGFSHKIGMNSKRNIWILFWGKFNSSFVEWWRCKYLTFSDRQVNFVKIIFFLYFAIFLILNVVQCDSIIHTIHLQRKVKFCFTNFHIEMMWVKKQGKFEILIKALYIFPTVYFSYCCKFLTHSIMYQ